MPKTCYAFNYYTLCKKIEVKDSAIEFLKEQGILKTSVKCKCGCDLATIKQRTGTGYYYFRCAKCDSMTSIRLLLLIIRLWCNWNMILPLTSLCHFCLQYTETFVYFNDATDWVVLLMLLLIKISILYELFKKIILKKDMYMFVFDSLIGMGPCLVIVILGWGPSFFSCMHSRSLKAQL